MNLSGIIVVCRADELPVVSGALAALPGVEVHHQDAAQGKIVLVQEAHTVEAEMEGLRHIKATPGVVLAEMVYHYFEEDPGILEVLGTRPDLAARPQPGLITVPTTTTEEHAP
jgi:periplasmic nitrate reductase NapD